MDIESVKEYIQVIRETCWDDESAHAMEDALHIAILKAISEGADNAVELAALALTTGEITFARWCA